MLSAAVLGRQFFCQPQKIHLAIKCRSFSGLLRTPNNRRLQQFVCRRTTSTAAAAEAKPTPKIVGWWMGGCAAMCFGAIVLGGVTRLTESGLSMVDWKLFGRPPPQGSKEWEAEFEKYRQSPEYVYKNTDITMEEFKWIWYMEYGHRMWGRLIGAAYFLPAGFMWYKGFFNAALKKRVVFAGLLLAGQGLLGWYMVKSGLDHKNFEGPSDVPRVSQYRLASHLTTAMVLYSVLFWNALSILKPPFAPTGIVHPSIKSFRRLVMSSKLLVFVTAISGAFVAGLDAGLIYNTFPLMADKFIPDDIMAYTPSLRNFTENPTTVQFDHRILGISTLALVSYVAIKAMRVPLPPGAQKAVIALTAMTYWQVAMGISTLLEFVPTHLAAAHQSGALMTLTMALWLSHELKLMKVLKHIPK